MQAGKTRARPQERPRRVTAQAYNVLFLCTGNSARSILAERILEHRGHGMFRAFSAGSFPTGTVNPRAVALLEKLGLSTEGLRSKSWNEFAVPDAPVMDFVFTVCDQAAGEMCPIWPGQPVTAHWGVPDPAAAEGVEDERMMAFREAYRLLDNRIRIFTSLPVAKLDRLTLTRTVREIGSSQDAGANSG